MDKHCCQKGLRCAALIVLGLTLAAVAPAQSQWEKRISRTTYDLTKAIDRARELAGTGFVFHAELEMDKGSLVYSIDLAQGKKALSVVLDAKDGKLVEKEAESDDLSAAVAACKTDLKSAIRAALKKRPGSAIEAQLAVVDSKPLIRVSVVSKGQVRKLRVDGVTGQLLAPRSKKESFTDRFTIQKAELGPTGKNPFFNLEPGFRLVLEGKEGDKSVRLVITNLNETRRIDGVETRVVEEREMENGQLIEISRNFFAISRKTNAVYYFGEEVDDYKDGKVVAHGGAWVSGAKKARFGLMMPGTPLLGARYYQEFAPGVAMDRARIVDLTTTLETPAGLFKNCLKAQESSALESAREIKIYARSIGLVQDADLKLVEYGMIKTKK